MRFELDEAQQAVAQVAGDLLEATATQPAGSATSGRSGAESAVKWPESSDGAVWKELGRSGTLSLAVPADLGGEGLGIGEISVLLTEIGRRAGTAPALAALSTLAGGVLPVARWGSADQRRDLLSGLPSGTMLTAALREPSVPYPERPGTLATPDLLLTGTKVGVPYAAQAYRILVPVSLPAPGGGVGVSLVDPSAPGVHLRQTPTSSGAPEYTVRLDGARADGLLGAADAPGRVLADLYRLAIAGTCAVGDGVVAGALALTTSHIGTRQQFGRPLAAFQAVAQQIADVYIAARTLHLAALSASWRLATELAGGQGTAADVDAAADGDLAVAAYWLASQGPPALRTCHHLHGGMGVDISYPMHRYSSLGKDLVRFLGGPEYCLDRVGRQPGAGLAPRGQAAGGHGESGERSCSSI